MKVIVNNGNVQLYDEDNGVFVRSSRKNLAEAYVEKYERAPSNWMTAAFIKSAIKPETNNEKSTENELQD